MNLLKARRQQSDARAAPAPSGTGGHPAASTRDGRHDGTRCVIPPHRRPWRALTGPQVEAARHADSRTTEHDDRARGNFDRHGVHFLTAYVAGV
jgi:hypothetical protein